MRILEILGTKTQKIKSGIFREMGNFGNENLKKLNPEFWEFGILWKWKLKKLNPEFSKPQRALAS